MQLAQGYVGLCLYIFLGCQICLKDHCACLLKGCVLTVKKNLIEQAKFSDTTKIRNKFKEVKLRRKITADVVWLQSPKYLKPGLLSFRT